MGFYINSTFPATQFREMTGNPYFVDKSMLLGVLFDFLDQSDSDFCITKPRRFGKTVMANMVGAFFGKGVDSSDIFDTLKISGDPEYHRHLNNYNVIYIDFSKMPENCKSFQQYIDNISNQMKSDLMESFPGVKKDFDAAIWDLFCDVFQECGEKFIFVLDEWDAIFHKRFINESDREAYLNFLACLIKDQPYVSLTYMTGILPIAKYSSGSSINNFDEYTMVADDLFSEYFGFTDDEVDDLFQIYLKRTKNPVVSREDLRYWYDGYHAADGKCIYNPRSVVYALRRNRARSYWTGTGPYSEISAYIINDIDDMRNDVALMVSGESISADVEEYAATSMKLSTKDEIFSAMVVYGFLDYEDGKVCIPNKELMDEFSKTIRREGSLGYVNRLARVSERMLQATLAGDTETMEEILEFAHNTETPIHSYNNEVELSAIVTLVYLSARDSYRVEREDKAGVGYVDFIFYPERKTADCIILELKVDHTPEEAIRQIKEKQYALRFKGKLGEAVRYSGRILAVGIGYDRRTKKHHCKVEFLSDRK
ncbi:MAG: ATP-binding protein [Lachnospiraceae bacterium]|nr:ATP-binding protein [Lachnospiraceae bacterium]